MLLNSPIGCSGMCPIFSFLLLAYMRSDGSISPVLTMNKVANGFTAASVSYISLDDLCVTILSSSIPAIGDVAVSTSSSRGQHFFS
jgi:hypothetical protein